MIHWVKVYNTSNRLGSEIIKQALIENQVEVISLNKQDSSYLFGTIDLYVPEEKFQIAIETLINNDLNGIE
jgi:hypothetical protein